MVQPLDTVYWHWKMHRRANWEEFKNTPVFIHTYFYKSQSNTFPECRCWDKQLVDSGHAATKADVKKLKCDSLEETQRNLSGTCYQSSFLITHIEASLDLTCQVKLITADQSSEHLLKTGVISIDIKVLLDITDTYRKSDDIIHALNTPNNMKVEVDNLYLFSDPPTDAGLFIPPSSIEGPLLPTADDISIVTNILKNNTEVGSSSGQVDVTTTYNTSQPTNDTAIQSQFSGQLTSSTSAPLNSFVRSTHNNETLNLSSLHLINPKYDRLFQFVPHGSVNACLDGEYSMECSLSQLTDVLELWFLGPVDTHSGLKNHSCLPTGECFRESTYLKASGHLSLELGTYGVRSIFERQVLLKLSNLTFQHSGVYLCKYRQSYRKLSVDVRLCGQRPGPSVLKNWPLAVFLGAILGLFCLLLLPLVVCIRVRRTKRVLTVISKVCPEGQTKLSNRRIEIVGRLNLLYPEGKDLTFVTKAPTNRPPRLQVFRRPKPPDVAMAAPRYCNSRDDHFWEVPSCRIHRQELIGQGGFSDVYLGTILDPLPGDQHRREGGIPASTTVAIKQLKGVFESSHLFNLVHELEIMKRLESHPNILRLLGCCSRTENGEYHPTLLLEYAQHGNLRDYLRVSRVDFEASVCDPPDDASGLPASLWAWDEPIPLDVDGQVAFSTSLLLRFACQAANALTYLHSVKLVHRDVAARNVLLTREYVVKLSDFGLSRMLGDKEVEGTAVMEENLPFYWMSPESLQSSLFSLPSDIWSFGILLWEIFSLGSSPYPGVSMSALSGWLEAGHRNSRSPLTPDSVEAVMHECWQYLPSDRPVASEVLRDLTAVAAAGRVPANAVERLGTGPSVSACQSGLLFFPPPPESAISSPTDSGIASIHHSECFLEQQQQASTPLDLNPVFDLTVLRTTASDMDDNLGVGGGGRPARGRKSPPRPPTRTSSLAGYVKGKVIVRKNKPPDLLDLPVPNYLDMRSAALNDYLEPRERLLMEVES